MGEREQLEQAIAAQAGLRGVVGDDVVDATISALQARLDSLAGVPAEKRRKQVTVLFADVSGFTSIGEDMDAEELADSVNLLWHRLDAAITDFNGRVDKHIGDAVMGLWGADEAREDDPEQAIRAALAMMKAVEDLAEHGSQLPIRIGINTGPVVLGEMGTTGEYTAMGSTVNTAARLEGAAPVGGILVNHDTYRHVRGVFAVQLQPPLEVKGLSEPLRTYTVTGVRPRAFRLRTRGVEGVETRMIGRQAELELLRDALGLSRRDERFQLVEVLGDAGIGKSRLLYEFEDWLRVQPDEVRLFTGRADRQHEGVPYALLRDVLLTRFEIADNDAPELVLAKLEAGVGGFLGDAAREQAHLIGHLIGLDLRHSDVLGGIIDDPKQMHDRALRAITQLFIAVTKEAPVVMLLEDIHWADQSSLETVLHVARTCAGAPILIVALTRPSLFERIPGWSDEAAGLIRIVLNRLSDDESGRLLEEVLQKVPHVPDVVRSQIVQNVDGNPFYVEELVKMLIEDGVIITSDEVWHMEPGRLTDLHVPATLTGVLQARLDRLPSRERDALERASVVGRIFWDAAIPPPGDEAAQPPESRTVQDPPEVLAALETKELIRTNDTPDFAGTSEFIFKHAILHDVTYEGVLRALRRTYHSWVARWLAGRPEISAHPAMIAGHFELGGLPTEAAEWYAEAAERARVRYANDEAIDYYRRALAPDTLDAASRVALNSGLGKVLVLQARYDEALAAIEQMLEHARASGDVGQQARALHAMSATHTRMGHNREALETAETAERLLRESDSVLPDELADILMRLGGAHLRLGHLEEARTRGEEALALATDSEHRQGLRGILNLLGTHNMAVGRHAGATSHFERSLGVSRELGDRIGEGRALLNLGEAARKQGDFAGAVLKYEEALVLQRELGDVDQETLTLSNLGGAQVGMGRYAEAIVPLQTAVSSFIEAGGSEHLSETHRFLAEAYLGLGKTGEALTEAREALRLGEIGENPDHTGNAWRVLGLVAAARGEPVAIDRADGLGSYDAMACFKASVAIFAEARMDFDRAITLWECARIEYANDETASAETRWKEAHEILENLGLPLFIERMAAERTV